MKLHLFILSFLFVGMGTIHCMKQPSQFRNMDWKAAIRTVDAGRAEFSNDTEYEGSLDQILDYAVDRYEKKKNKKLSKEDREKKKKELLNRVRRGK